MEYENSGVVSSSNDTMEKMEDDDAAVEEDMEECGGGASALPECGNNAEGCARSSVFMCSNNSPRGAGAKMLVKERYVEPDYPRLPNEGNLEWQYTMRRTMQEIIPGVFLGPYASATRAKLEEMKAAGLTHIVCVRQDLERNLIRPNHPEHFKYIVVEMGDSATENIIPHFRTVNEFLSECLSNGGRALVHGNAGISRSAALVIAFIMSRYGVTLKEAFSYVQSKRFCCNPNEGFMAQLREYEPIYRAQHTVPLPLPTDVRNRVSLKRSFEPEEGDYCQPAYPNNGQFSGASRSIRFPDCNNTTAQLQPRQLNTFSSSSESSVSSSSESLPHNAFPNHNAAMTMLPTTQQTDTPMSTI